MPQFDRSTNPMSPRDGVAAYERARYAHLDQRVLNALEHRLIARLIGSIGIARPTLLNAPCGFGRFADIVEKKTARRVFLDLHPGMVRRCNSTLGPRGFNIVNGSLRNLPFDDAAFDVVMNIRFFHHYFEQSDRRTMLAELARVSKRFVILTYYQRSWIHSLNKKYARKKNRIVLLERAAFETELAEAGLRVVSAHRVAPAVHAQTFLLLEKTGG
jgi:ubiquinone/menaquinone biosynthesis C-methylase UbiE